ncbi:MAG: hypothetical protein C0594_05525 [Marinilabiliales bacterium]|nr:MAG: hypothetical protein C0594_05525 [Marinilabiliales bacterium]
MKTLYFVLIALVFAGFSCKKVDNKGTSTEKTTEIKTDKEKQIINSKDKTVTIDLLVKEFGEAHRQRIEKGVMQTADLWRAEDGNIEAFQNFCKENFIVSDDELKSTFFKISENFEKLNGYYNKLTIELKKPLHEDIGKLSKIDHIFGAFSPYAHLESDLYQNKIAFIVSLNFPFYSLQEKTEMGENWSRLEWAYARMGDRFVSRIPSALKQEYSKVTSIADTYISEYNIYMGKLKDNNGNQLFPDDLRLISHWGLRDELKSNYSTENGLAKQKMIYTIMDRIITQEIPEKVINDKQYTWNPLSNSLFENDQEIQFKPEPNTRYQHMLEIFNALRAMDAYNPKYNTYIKRKFEQEMEIPQQEVEKLFVDLVSSPQVKEVAQLISNKLGRDLEPFDIWYNGFTPRNNVSEEELNQIIRKLYPDTKAFQKALPGILVKLGWDQERADEITSKIEVDAARGAGHAWGAEMKSDVAHLRTRIPSDGMMYKGYNIAVHEFGHNVEQTITLQDIDYYMLRGVPNTAFTEAIAFIFQKRDLQLLDMESDSGNKEDMMALDIFWSCYEIMGVSLVDMKVWQWLYENPNATAEELKAAVLKISKEVWNQYYADVFGVKDQNILAIYSHMIDAPLYLSAYPIGHLIDFQIEKSISGKDFPTEIEKILKQGRIIPQLWMKNGIGGKLSVDPILEATSVALKKVK